MKKLFVMLALAGGTMGTFRELHLLRIRNRIQYI